MPWCHRLEEGVEGSREAGNLSSNPVEAIRQGLTQERERGRKGGRGIRKGGGADKDL